MFRHDTNVDIEHTRYLERIAIPPIRLVELFGQPATTDGYKISGLYSFTDDQGNVFTLYDWKATSLYDDRSDIVGIDQAVRTPEEFWRCPTPLPFHIGGREGGDLTKFKAWLKAKTAIADVTQDAL